MQGDTRHLAQTGLQLFKDEARDVFQAGNTQCLDVIEKSVIELRAHALAGRLEHGKISHEPADRIGFTTQHHLGTK